jgi:iron complex transport system substrate-binding protein
MRGLMLSLCLGLFPVLSAATDLPDRVVSISLCTDVLALELARPGQLQSVSWLAVHPQQSLVAGRVGGLHLNHGRLEEVIGLQPDLVLASQYSSPYLLQQLERLEIPVLTLADAQTLVQVQENLCLMSLRLRGSCAPVDLPALPEVGPDQPSALMVQVGGWTSSAPSLMDEFLQRMGMRNLAGAAGVQGWGMLDLEQILRLHPDWVFLVGGNTERRGHSQKEQWLRHPVLHNTRVTRVRAHELPAGHFGCGSLALLDLVQQTKREILEVEMAQP